MKKSGGCQVAPTDDSETAAPQEAPLVERIRPEGVIDLPIFMPVVRVGDLVFLSGMLGFPASFLVGEQDTSGAAYQTNLYAQALREVNGGRWTSSKSSRTRWHST